MMVGLDDGIMGSGSLMGGTGLGKEGRERGRGEGEGVGRYKRRRKGERAMPNVPLYGDHKLD